MKKKRKVLFFVDRLRHGGIQQFIVENIKKINHNLVDIEVLVLDDGNDYPLEDKLKQIGIKVFKLKNVWINNPLDYINYTKKIKSFFSLHNDYDVIHMNASSKNYIILKYAKKNKIKVRIAHSHNIDFQTKKIGKKLVGNIFKILLKKYATDYFACSKLAGTWLFGKKNVESGKVKVIHNAVDYDKYKFNEKNRKEIRNEFSISDSTVVIGNVGRFSNQKNHTFLIEIFYHFHKLNNDSILILVGEGENETIIRKKVREYRLEKYVIFAGYRNDVNKVMSAFDIFLLPSLYEGLPIVGVEAQAAGLPIYASKDVVTEELKIASNVNFISLDESPEKWAIEILKNDNTRKDNYNDFKNNKYIIDDIASELTKYYLK